MKKKPTQEQVQKDATGGNRNASTIGQELKNAAKRNGMKSSYKAKPIKWNTIKKQIDKKQPIIAGIRWISGGGHWVVVRGYSAKEKLLYINDSWPMNHGKRWEVKYSDFKSRAYGNNGGSRGWWEDTLINFKKK